jgi:UDP-N-acetylmuramate--alanine ligase
MKLSDYKHVHCIGIGGIGLSALARYCHQKGAAVTGSDGGTSRVTEDLSKEGVVVYQGHNEAHLSSSVDLVIYSIAVGDTNPELALAKTKGVKVMTYPEALGLLTEEYETIAVCGTHGKTTTTAMLYQALLACGESPSIIVGSLLAGEGSNFVLGTGKYLVVEACEYKRSFLNLHPKHILVTNIDRDHLDYYKDIEDIRSAFTSFAQKVPHDGYVVTHQDVSLSHQAKNLDADKVDQDSISLSVLGKHNRSNAQLVIALLLSLGFPEDRIREGLLSFGGTWRRQEYKGLYKDALLYDDYGHHPEEIKATLQALREKYSKGEYKLIAFFQPHLYSRTKEHLHEFAQSFLLADEVFFLPIYAAREAHDPSVSSSLLAELTPSSRVVASFEDAQKYIEEHAQEKTVFLTIGAGDVYRVYDGLVV